MQGAGAKVAKKRDNVYYPTLGLSKYTFDCEVIDNRTGERSHIHVDANTKASASKRCKELGYTVMSMGWV